MSEHDECEKTKSLDRLILLSLEGRLWSLT
jgi:hypothetical protein